MVYFCNRPISIDINIVEFQRLREFRDEMKTKGIYAEFATTDQFEGLLYQHLDKKVEDCIDGRLPIPSQQEKVGAGAVKTAPGTAPQSHSPIDFGTTLPEISAGFMRRMQEFARLDG